MLKELCELFLAGYFTSNSIKGSTASGEKAGYHKDREEMGRSRRSKRGSKKEKE
jgi:hypothetical protein